MLDFLTKVRRDLHQIPELGFDLFKTKKYVKDLLISFGYNPVTYAKTGLVVKIKGVKEEAVAFRADMDALPVNELTNVSYKSKHEGVMHACGHDGHTAILLGLAKTLKDYPMPKESIILIFQPAEEGPGGAKVMIDEGLIKDYKIKKIFGLHLFPGINEGLIGIKNGEMLAQNAEFDYDIYGKSSHGAQPHLGVDSIIAASNFIISLNQIVSRNINPLEKSVVTTGIVNGGEARNIIAGKTSIKGTIRAFNEKTYNTLKEKMTDLKLGIEKSFNVSIKGGITDGYPPVINDESLFELVRKSFDKDDLVYLEPYMFAEDFAYYQQEVPGIFSFIGTLNKEKEFTYPLHSNKFNFDEKVLLNGLNYYFKIIENLLLY
ncbi:MAG: M20 family metallopeptidase [Acholeplasmataceae bacterium]